MKLNVDETSRYHRSRVSLLIPITHPWLSPTLFTTPDWVVSDAPVCELTPYSRYWVWVHPLGVDDLSA